MLELDMCSQDPARAVSEEEDCVELQALAAVDPAGAPAIATAPVVRPEWLLCLPYGPANSSLFIYEDACAGVAVRGRRVFYEPVSDRLGREDAVRDSVKIGLSLPE